MAKKTSPKIRAKSANIVVAIGASAGGSVALKELFATIQNAQNISIIVIQHLEDSGKGLALETLKRVTKLKVQELTDGLELQPNRVYVVPPHSKVSFKDQKVKLAAVRSGAARVAVIDNLFNAIGVAFHECAIGVVLSGDGSDGAAGVRELNEAGGLTLAQSPETASHPSMPEAAIATGAVDHALPLKKIWQEISTYQSYIAHVGSSAERASLKDQINSSLSSICDILLKATRHDFKHYKSSTLLRRIQRRIQVLHLESVSKYLKHLESNSGEVEILFKELLINVTSFFRDEDSFEVLRDSVLATLVENRKVDQKIRIWAPGCSTGEEPYTIAILLRELIETLDHPPEVQIIATDIDDVALNVARRGSYSAAIAAHVSPARLAKYFVKRNGRYHVSKEIREMCLFSVHNLISDPPFSQLDLISCRNLLIYLGPHLQKKLFPVFHYALRPGGYLFLGTSETLTTHRELFRPVSMKHRIAQRKQTAIKLPSINTSVQTYLSQFNDAEKAQEADLNLIGQRIALDEMPFRYAIVNDEAQILSSSAGIGKYVQFTEGAFQNNIIKLVHPSLRATLRASFNRAKKEKRKVVNDACTLKTEKAVERIGIIVQPMPQLGELSELYWVAFQSLGTIHPDHADRTGGGTEYDVELVDRLERELSLARQELDKSVQDLEASNEELKSSNEELLSMNEELQSANEELETSKEEVQNSNDALQRANTDLENLLASTQIATLFLDDEYRIRGFTPAIQEIYNIQQTDVGRKLFDFTSRALRMPPYPEYGETTELETLEEEIKLPTGKTFLRRMHPYRTPDNVRQGIVITFIDVSDQVRARNVLENAKSAVDHERANFQNLFKQTPEMVCILTGPEHLFVFVNEAHVRALGFDATGKKVREAQPESVEIHGILDRVYQTGETAFLHEIPVTVGTKLRYFNLTYAPQFAISGGISGVMILGMEITEEVEARAALERSRASIESLLHQLEEKSAQLETMIEQMPMSVIFAEAPSGKLLFANRQFEKIWKYAFIPSPDIEGYGDYVGYHPDGRRYESTDWPLARTIKTGQPILNEDTIVGLGSGEKAIFSISSAPVKNARGEVVAAIVLSEDVTERRQAEQRVKFSKEEADAARAAAEAANESKTRFLANMSHEIRTPLSAIIGFSDLLKAQDLKDPDANAYTERISRNAVQLGRLIDDLLDLSKIEADKFEIESSTIDLDSLIEDVFAALTLRAQEKGISLEVTWSSKKPDHVFSDAVRLRQILTNIVGNAVKFTERGSINVDFSVDGAKLVIRVCDTGIGLSQEQQRRIFEPFMQADSSVTRKYGGTGLGLALSKRLARLLGGELRLEKSDVGEGSVFLIEIAREVPSELAHSQRNEPVIKPDLGKNALVGTKILVVDDSPDNRAIVQLYLESVGAAITEASNGDEAVKVALSKQFDVVLMDIQMPVKDGYQAMKDLLAAGYKQPVVALTAHAFKAERDKCLALGFARYITKPINRVGLVQSVWELSQSKT